MDVRFERPQIIDQERHLLAIHRAGRNANLHPPLDMAVDESTVIDSSLGLAKHCPFSVCFSWMERPQMTSSGISVAWPSLMLRAGSIAYCALV
jgi:hypothetical protein